MIKGREEIWCILIFYDELGSIFWNIWMYRGNVIGIIDIKCFKMFKLIQNIHGREEIWCVLVSTMHWEHWYQMLQNVQMYPIGPWYRETMMYFGIYASKCFKCIQMIHDREEMKPFELFWFALNWDFNGWFVSAKWHILAISVIMLHLPFRDFAQMIIIMSLIIHWDNIMTVNFCLK